MTSPDLTVPGQGGGEIWPPVEEFGEYTFERREIVDWFVNPQGARTSSRTTVRRKVRR